MAALDIERELTAMLKIGNSHVMMADAWPRSREQGPKDTASAGLWACVEDRDGLFMRASEAGREVRMPMEDEFRGDRTGNKACGNFPE